jgi:hypothetical protein
MTAYEWCEVLAIGAVIVTAVTWLNRGPDADDDADRQRWQDTTRARTEDDDRHDGADRRRADEIAQLYDIWPDPPRGTAQLPTQTRRTEEDQ